MQMPGRDYTATGKRSRHSINGQERSDELNDNLTTAMYWEYDSRIGRRWNVDPVVKEFESPYLCFAGNPIWFSDKNGDDAEPPKPNKLFHNSEKAKQIIKKGFDAITYGKDSKYNWFSSTPNSSTTGRAAVGETIELTNVDVSKAKVISAEQTTAWRQEAMKELGIEKKRLNELKKIKTEWAKTAHSKLMKQIDARLYSKVGAYMDETKAAIYFLEKDATFAMTDAVANSGTRTLISRVSAVKTMFQTVVKTITSREGLTAIGGSLVRGIAVDLTIRALIENTRATAEYNKNPPTAEWYNKKYGTNYTEKYFNNISSFGDPSGGAGY
jgi:hypothetical protein